MLTRKNFFCEAHREKTFACNGNEYLMVNDKHFFELYLSDPNDKTPPVMVARWKHNSCLIADDVVVDRQHIEQYKIQRNIRGELEWVLKKLNA